MASRQGPRPGGRSARVQASVHEAARELLATTARECVTVPAIAERAGVTPSTIYRRWGGLPDLLGRSRRRAPATGDRACRQRRRPRRPARLGGAICRGDVVGAGPGHAPRRALFAGTHVGAAVLQLHHPADRRSCGASAPPRTGVPCRRRRARRAHRANPLWDPVFGRRPTRRVSPTSSIGSSRPRRGSPVRMQVPRDAQVRPAHKGADGDGA